ncbi:MULTISPECIES: excalibur calcium-binding domain-containing protein [unclassified Crossiella]|uniref:excalibur calcium-binding domain-containing protein n=1 Tax=unclassified Crossiella TaxID=2620835 RepID=UPI0020001881|nr:MULTISPECIES: excalibur calcium-binding domain-containing protein [unclassified Crossiella]MCK2241609.1 excalibur calcium-binding domain-containing protein [Crossiella sp. S99.2]MCK2255519.1 excalibur calcium-binding domain-containing protein [Crossiella sp. S99.1]
MSLTTWWQSRKRKWPWVAGLVLLGLAIIGGLTGGRGTTDPGTSVTVSAAAETPAGVIVPPGVIGKNPKEAKAELAALGFRDVRVESVDGRQVIVESNWRVVSVTSMGTAVAVTTRLVLRVDKSQPSTTTEAPPPTTRRPDPSPEPPPAPEPTRQTKPAPVYYKNCDDVRSKGAAPLHRGEPGYGKHLDRDGDGVACEK